MVKCPHKKSDMTPCYIEDGEVTLCYMSPSQEGPPTHCVGCERSQELLDIEAKRLKRGDVCK